MLVGASFSDSTAGRPAGTSCWMPSLCRKLRRHLPPPLFSHLCRCSASITLVCRRWREVFLSAPQLWREYALAPAEGLAQQQQAERAATHAAVLARVGGAVHKLRLHATPALVAALAQSGSASCRGTHATTGSRSAVTWACLRALSPEALSELKLTLALPSPTAAQQLAAALDLARFTKLQLLELRVHLAPVPASLAAALCQLPLLRRLTLHSGTHPLPPGALLPAACPALTSLTRLELRCQRLPPTEAFTALGSLQCLHLVEAVHAASPAAAEGAAPCCDGRQPPLPDSLPNFAAFSAGLRHLSVTRELAVRAGMWEWRQNLAARLLSELLFPGV